MKRLFKLAVFVALVSFAVKMLMEKKQEWEGLSEPEVRTKLDAKLGDRVPPEKLGPIQDKVVEGMRSAGVLREDDVSAGEAVGAPDVQSGADEAQESQG